MPLHIMWNTNQGLDPMRQYSWPNSQALYLGWTSTVSPGLVSVMFLSDMFILCHICKLSFPQMYHYILLRFLRCSIHFIFVNVLYSNLSQSRICSYLISLESLEVTLPCRSLAGKKKQQLKFSIDKGVFSSS